GWGLGFKVQGTRFKVQGSRFKVQGLGFGVWGLGFGVLGSRFRVLRRVCLPDQTNSASGAFTMRVFTMQGFTTGRRYSLCKQQANIHYAARLEYSLRKYSLEATWP
ncbi:hypothetical protein T484DRAFT_1614971, partial [Baffinella frigidus]